MRALARTGNVRAAAAAAGVDPGTAYDHRHKDANFAARWDKALAKARARDPLHRATHGPPPRPGEELVARRSRGRETQLVKAAAGRWSAGAEAAFLAELERTGNVRAAARACRLSTTALYNRRKRYAGFAGRWAAAEAAALERLPALLAAAAIASLDPGVEGEPGLPAVDVGQAIAILRLKGAGGGAAEARAGRGVPEAPPIEAVRDEVVRRLAAIRRHRDSGGGGEDEAR